MKKLFYSLMAATMLFATSCSEDEVLTENNGNEAEVTFTTNLDGVLASRAIADGTTVNQLSFGVFDAQGNLIQALCQNNITVEGKKATVKVNLVKGQTYSFTFWAQSSEATCYTLTDYKTLAVNYNNAAANDETRDAFFAVRKDLTVKGSVNETITLKRPFAQINVGTTEADLTAASTAGITVKNSAFAITTNVPNSLDLLAGTASGSTAVTFASNAIPTEDLKNVNGKDYEYLAMNYVLAGTEKAIVDANFTLLNGTETIATLKVPNLPVQRNYRTNIVGNILTSEAVFDVVVDEEFEDDNNYVTNEELIYVMTNGGEFTMTKDITLTETYEPTNDVTINLNGHTLKYEGDNRLIKARGVTVTLNGDVTGSALVVESNNLDASTTAAYIGTAYTDGKIIINGGTYTTNGCTTFHANDGEIIINDGTFSATETGYSQPGKYEYKYTLNVQGSNGTIIVKGGTFKNYNPAYSEGENPVANFVAEGYISYKSAENEWTVAKAVATADELTAALAEGGEVALTADVKLETSLIVAAGKSVSINLNGKNITNTSTSENFGEAEGIIAYGELTIEGTGTVQANSMAVWARGTEGAKITINGGTYKGLSSELAKGGRSVIYASSGNTINIYGGTFEAMAADKTSFANKTDGVYAALNIADNNGFINVYGGSFKNFDPANPGTEPKAWNNAHPKGFVAEGYKSTSSADGWYTVTAE